MEIIDRRFFLAAVVGGACSVPFHSAAHADASRLASQVDAFVRSSGFNGVVQLVEGPTPLLSKAYGMADIEAGRGASMETVYPIASISKWLTSVTVLRLVDQRLLDLDGAIAEYLPFYRTDTGGKVLLKHLLSNSSGIPDQFGPMVTADPTIWKRRFSTEEAIRAFCSGDLLFEPGSRFAYKFTNWVLAKGIVEAATGEDFAVAMDRLLLRPLQLSSIRPSDEPDVAARLAAGYAAIDPPVRKMYPLISYTLASGGYCGTASDLIRAAQQVYGSGFLSAESLTALSTVLVPEEHYALGGRVRSIGIAGIETPFAWHTGRVDGYRALLAHRLDGQQSLAVLNNSSIEQRDIDLFAEALLASV